VVNNQTFILKRSQPHPEHPTICFNMDKFTTPLVSIGLPVYNGENYLDQAIKSVLNQTYRNWELVISDNASTDATRAICEKYLNQDKRIRYYRFDKNYGAAKNYNTTFHLSRGIYFKWLAHDDLLASTNIQKSTEILELHRDVVLCGSQKATIDAYGKILNTYELKYLKLNEDNPILRYKLLLKFFTKGFSHADFVFGLMRKDILEHTPLIGNFVTSDGILLLELILKGQFYVIDEPLFFRRIHDGISTLKKNNAPKHSIQMNKLDQIPKKSYAEMAKWFDPNGKKRHFPQIKWAKQLTDRIHNERFKKSDQIKLCTITYIWATKELLYYIQTHYLKRLSKKIKSPIILISRQRSLIYFPLNPKNSNNESRNTGRWSRYKIGQRD